MKLKIKGGWHGHREHFLVIRKDGDWSNHILSGVRLGSHVLINRCKWRGSDLYRCVGAFILPRMHEEGSKKAKYVYLKSIGKYYD